MHLLNKYERAGIFFSVVVMALALSAVRFKTDVFVKQDADVGNEASVITVNNEKDPNNVALEGALKDAFTGSGKFVDLVIDDVRIGTGSEVKSGDTVSVHYIGTTQDGVKFDSSYDRSEPFSFTVGAGKVIAGWEKGLIGMKIGGQRILVIPSDMAYGNRQVGLIPPNSPLVFAIELLEIKK
jgi:FKBP-type peptidyl-prolyl cis-trans isomerase